MIHKMKQIYFKSQYNPIFFSVFLNPFYFARKGLYVLISRLSSNLSGRLLDVGCGSKPYKNFFNVHEYIGLEIDDGHSRNNGYADVLYDGKTMPFSDGYFNSVLCNQVFEHVFYPDEFLIEVNRVLALDGYVLFSVPFVWDEHEQPNDFARYTSYGLTSLFSKHGFEIVELHKSCNGVELIFQLMNAYLYKVLLTKNPYINLLFTVLIMSPINMLGLLLSYLTPRNNDLYLDNVVLARKVRGA